jgi:hypothetical protein
VARPSRFAAPPHLEEVLWNDDRIASIRPLSFRMWDETIVPAAMSDAGDPGPSEEFVGEALTPTPGTFDASAMARGEAGVPREFTWRGQTHVVAALMSSWKGTGQDRGETYLRRHWFRVRTTTGTVMTIYCERQARSAKKPKARWWVYTVAR